ncbi:hypothetical protein DP73_03895 [Desulfosporosinus sp. HMP52]|uniref:YveK family protein n=1 Tax=Desulfosporosinus sp. HMP52 TaxID=1487923 RepID=UPI00051FED8F|nr:Wzz/FepE/Etk N-terminal domain-containing protein [Desulfosporosinus sp. HMP52]KGK91413.1 hypothetical protein DP73_03895 [Desulfosporosinus sp. HMP52]
MEIKRILSSVARKWWLVVLLVILGGGLGFVINFNSKPIYQADTTLYIINRDKLLTDGSLNSQDIAVSEQLVRQYYDIIYSRLVISEVLREVKGYNLSEKAILSMVSLSSNSESNIFTISAKSDDPELASVVANATGQAFTKQIRELTNSDNVGILDEAQEPISPLSNNKIQIVFVGLLAGLMSAFFVVYILEYFDTTVHSAEDIEKGLKVRVIGIIPENNIR